MPLTFQPVSTHQKGAAFPVRRMDFDFHDINPVFIKSNPVSSALWTAFQAYFPEGEQFFVDSVRTFKSQITDEQLKRDVSAFIGQEAMHGKEHRTANEALAAQGIHVEGLDKAALWVRKRANRYLPKRLRLAMTAAAEHYTGVIAHQIAHHPNFLNSVTDPKIRQLILWHAMEETEHRAVAFDLYQHAARGYLTRALGMAVVSAGIGPVVLLGMINCLRQQKELGNTQAWKEFAKDYFSPGGFFSAAIPELVKYFKPGFHPNDQGPEMTLAVFRRELGLQA
ncbi:MAG TPA: metal-dependent hydrolase [Limnobacter sp.]|uniref:metal-dependent hydrolase n=1 Tax=Limnobacter sp. TaxID=2003368 RepID=UPI002E308AEF|nr:metal-dependent hydrolase [Limnobacter sp.]HEX5487026.1 metal-dependent hydrolase [Limnobacter sp.]